MSDEQQSVLQESVLQESVLKESAAEQSAAMENSDSKADATAIIVIFTAAVLFCVFYISGWSFDL